MPIKYTLKRKKEIKFLITTDYENMMLSKRSNGNYGNDANAPFTS